MAAGADPDAPRSWPVNGGVVYSRVDWAGESHGAPAPARRCRIEDRVRVNHQIRLSPVRLIGASGEQIGVVPIEEARRIAEEAGLDLVEVAAETRPIVVKIMDWGKHRFEAAKKAREARRKESRIEVKQIKLRPNIDDHDLGTKMGHVRRFLEDGDKVRVTIMFRGRDLRRPENGRKVLDRVIEHLAEICIVEAAPGEIVNRDMSMTLAPKRR